MDPSLYALAWGFVWAGILTPFLLLGIFAITFSCWLWGMLTGKESKFTSSTGPR